MLFHWSNRFSDKKLFRFNLNVDCFNESRLLSLAKYLISFTFHFSEQHLNILKMLQPLFPKLSAVVSITILLIFTTVARSEIIPDATLSESFRVVRQGNIRRIEGGTQRGSNLFHSFQEFSLPTEVTTYFNNSEAIENVFLPLQGW